MKSHCKSNQNLALSRHDIAYSPVVICWRAVTAKGRPSVYRYRQFYGRTEATMHNKRVGDKVISVHYPSRYYGTSIAELLFHAKARSNAILPSLPRGYSWGEPFVEIEIPKPMKEGPLNGVYFVFGGTEEFIRGCDTSQMPINFYLEKLANEILTERGFT